MCLCIFLPCTTESVFDGVLVYCCDIVYPYFKGIFKDFSAFPPPYPLYLYKYQNNSKLLNNSVCVCVLL